MFKLIRNLSLLGALGILAACTTPQVRQAAAPGTTVSPQYNVSKNGVAQWCSSGLTQNGLNYNFTGDCSVVPPPPVANQLTRANILYVGHAAAQVPNVDLTQWAPVWGRIDAASPPLTWPPRATSNGATPQWSLGKTQFTCAQFIAVPNGGTHTLSASSYNTASNFSAAISQTCGDFTPVGPACHKEGVGAFDATFLRYGMNANTNFYCGLTPNGVYYLNVKWTDNAPIEPNPVRPICNVTSCKIAIQSN